MKNGYEQILNKSVELMHNGSFQDAASSVSHASSEILKGIGIIKAGYSVYLLHKEYQIKKMIKNIKAFLDSADYEKLQALYEKYAKEKIIDQIIIEIMDCASAEQSKVIAHLTNAFAEKKLPKEEFNELVYATKQINPAGLMKSIGFDRGDDGYLVGEMIPYLMSQGMAYSLSQNDREEVDREARLARHGITSSRAQTLKNTYVSTRSGHDLIKYGIKPFQLEVGESIG